MPQRRTTFNFSRLATVAYLGSICLAVVELANALNEHQLLRATRRRWHSCSAGFSFRDC